MKLNSKSDVPNIGKKIESKKNYNINKNINIRYVLCKLVNTVVFCFKYVFYKVFYFVKINPKRNYGLDLARIGASLFVTFYHLLENIKKTNNYELKKYSHLLFLITNGNNNMFALLSGFFIAKKINIRRIIYLIAQVFYYIYYDYCPYLEKHIYDKKVSPRPKPDIKIVTQEVLYYWYFISYLPLCFIFPLINPRLNYMSYALILFALFTFFFLIPFYYKKDIYKEGNGHSIFHLFHVGLMGVCINQMKLHRKGFFLIWGILYILLIYISYNLKYGDIKYKEYLWFLEYYFRGDTNQ